MEWQKRKGKSDGEPWTRHYLFDEQSGRVFGLIEEPVNDEICFWADPDHGPNRRWLTLDSAKLYLEQCAMRGSMEEARDLVKYFEEEKQASVTTRRWYVAWPKTLAAKATVWWRSIRKAK